MNRNETSSAASVASKKTSSKAPKSAPQPEVETKTVKTKSGAIAKLTTDRGKYEEPASEKKPAAKKPAVVAKIADEIATKSASHPASPKAKPTKSERAPRERKPRDKEARKAYRKRYRQHLFESKFILDYAIESAIYALNGQGTPAYPSQLTETGQIVADALVSGLGNFLSTARKGGSKKLTDFQKKGEAITVKVTDFELALLDFANVS